MKDSDNVIDFGVSDADKKVILDFHNKVRREVMPIASDLTAIVSQLMLFIKAAINMCI